MNISKIHSMAIQGDLSVQALRYLIDCHGECEHLDYKEQIDFSNERDCIGITKDILAMKNIGGGYILIGVRDTCWEPIGITNSYHMDTKKFRDQIQKYSGLDIETDYVEHETSINNLKKRFAIILIRATSKTRKLLKPSICKKSFGENEKWGIRSGVTYIRDGDSTIKLVDYEKLSEKLGNLELMYQEADQKELFSTPSPFKIESGLYRILPPEYEGFVGRTELLKKVKDNIEKDDRIWIINLFGPGGVGKSAIATRVAYEFYSQKTFEAILHLSAKDKGLSDDGIKALKPSLISLEDFIDRILKLFSYDECCSDNLESKKKLVNELLSAWRTLIILDNMETVTDGRIMDFITEFPQSTKAKVLLTSRQRSRTWEMPVQVPELSESEILEFIKIRSEELQIEFPLHDKAIIQKISELSGGLPLALQWILGDFARTNDLDSILNRVITQDSPLLEFSFRHSWSTLSIDAKHALAVLPIFSKSPTQQEWRTVLNWTNEKIENAIGELIQSTFVTKQTNNMTGENVYNALPITLSFAKNELLKLGILGDEARKRLESYRQRVNLATEELQQNEGLFSQFDASTDNQKLAILLTKTAEGQISSLGFGEAEDYFIQALNTDPYNVYALVKYALFCANLQEDEKAIELFERAITKSNKKNGFFIYYNYADMYGLKRDWVVKVKYLQKAMGYQENCPQFDYTMAQHSLGIAYGQLHKHDLAIKVFDEIIENELRKPYGPTKSLIVAARTKKISLSRLKQPNPNAFIDELIIRCERFKNSERIIEELNKLKKE